MNCCRGFPYCRRHLTRALPQTEHSASSGAFGAACVLCASSLIITMCFRHFQKSKNRSKFNIKFRGLVNDCILLRIARPQTQVYKMFTRDFRDQDVCQNGCCPCVSECLVFSRAKAKGHHHHQIITPNTKHNNLMSTRLD